MTEVMNTDNLFEDDSDLGMARGVFRPELNSQRRLSLRNTSGLDDVFDSATEYARSRQED